MTLNELNYKELIHLDIENVEQYSFDDYLKNKNHHPNICGFCTKCEEAGCNICPNDSDYLLQNISHGSSSKDFLDAIYPKYDITNWNKAGVMFIMESPSRDYKIYEEKTIMKDNVTISKRPAVQWYWIHNTMEINGYPHYFKGGEYGKFVASAIVTFRLSNAYMTNLVKCGMNRPSDGSYKGISDFDPKCIKLCYESFLKKEIEIVEPKIIFTFGTKVYDKVCSLLNNQIRVVSLPHPAGQQRGFKNEYYNVLYFCMIAKSLYQENIIGESFYTDLMERFAEKRT